jgi:hypothetical protein
MVELTLCSVSFHSAEYLSVNEALVRALNPGVDARWIVAENSPAGTDFRLSDNDPRFTMLAGEGPGHLPNYQHTLALRRCTGRATTRFVAVLDPDLFVVRPNWIREVIAHMQGNGLAMIGVPWHPQSQGKYRYFPAVHLTVFDTALFPRELIDFRPDYPDGDHDPVWPTGWTLESSYFVRSRSAALLARLPWFRDRRQYYTDTGSRLYKRWADDPTVRYETLVPRWRAAKATRPTRAIVAALIPDELSYSPKHYPRASYDPHTMRAVVDELPAHWECFEWQQKFFAFHVRGNLDRQMRQQESEHAKVRRLVEAAIEAAASI